mmetsp:Transcript_15807/g.42116  ORF Transcript_15807/g.42116 Transcript_15807/m.42116 type:complete len:404 (-) Transcript_15807:115-1326(-)
MLPCRHSHLQRHPPAQFRRGCPPGGWHGQARRPADACLAGGGGEVRGEPAAPRQQAPVGAGGLRGGGDTAGVDGRQPHVHFAQQVVLHLRRLPVPDHADRHAHGVLLRGVRRRELVAEGPSHEDHARRGHRDPLGRVLQGLCARGPADDRVSGLRQRGAAPRLGDFHPADKAADRGDHLARGLLLGPRGPHRHPPGHRQHRRQRRHRLGVRGGRVQPRRPAVPIDRVNVRRIETHSFAGRYADRAPARSGDHSLPVRTVGWVGLVLHLLRARGAPRPSTCALPLDDTSKLLVRSTSECPYCAGHIENICCCLRAGRHCKRYRHDHRILVFVRAACHPHRRPRLRPVLDRNLHVQGVQGQVAPVHQGGLLRRLEGGDPHFLFWRRGQMRGHLRPSRSRAVQDPH